MMETVVCTVDSARVLLDNVLSRGLDLQLTHSHGPAVARNYAAEDPLEAFAVDEKKLAKAIKKQKLAVTAAKRTDENGGRGGGRGRGRGRGRESGGGRRQWDYGRQWATSGRDRRCSPSGSAHNRGTTARISPARWWAKMGASRGAPVLRRHASMPPW